MEHARRRLIEIAAAARERAYAPYSGFAVGAALECEDGQVFSGCNVENAVYPVGLCAERAALAGAVSGGQRRFRRIAIVADAAEVCAPCGMCRQALAEFAPDLEVVMANLSGREEVISLADLLPRSFTARYLPKAAAEGGE